MMRHQIMMGLMVTALLGALTPRDLSAGDDGGGRSIFALGAGNRALALGGAYGALANDASAPLWNPGGLGLALRSEIQVSQTSYFGIGMDEQFGSLVFPHWRWGTFSLTFRHFGVDGIEQRDDRNILLNDDLSDNESEFVLGYGKSVTDAWHVGATLKVRRHELAGFSSSGIGMDLGVVVNPLAILNRRAPDTRRWAVGLTIRNALEPHLRLVEESVADPLGLRVGTSYSIPFSGTRQLLAAIDIEKTRNMDARVHAGAELSLHPLLALRAGLSNGDFTAGTSVAWSGVSIDYAFEQNGIENVHRVGAAFTFGPTTIDSRRSAIEARDRALQEQLAAAFEKRQTERIDELVEQAEAARQQAEFEEALEILSVAATLAPGHPRVITQQAAVLRELARKLEMDGDYAAATVSFSRALALAPDDPVARAGEERCREAGDRIATRSADIRRRFGEALDAFSTGDLVKAQAGFANILRAVPNDPDAAAMLARTNLAIDTQVRQLLDDAERFIEWGHLSEADYSIGEARKLNPRSQRLDDVSQRLREANMRVTPTPADTQQAQDSRPAAESQSDAPAARTLSDSQRREAEHLYKRAVEAMTRGESDEAIRYLELVLTIDPRHSGVIEHLKREYLTRGMEHFADGNLDRAVALWESVLRIDPNDERARGYLTRAHEQASRTRQILGENR